MRDEHDFRRVERIDGFVDAAFAFSVSLLVISVGDPPTDLAELRRALLLTPAFAAGFALIALFWWAHHTYAALRPRRDGYSLLLSLAIVFVVLVYVFPLRLLMQTGLAFMSGGLLPGGDLIQSAADLRLLYVVYGAGFLALSVLYGLLFAHAAQVLRQDGQAERAKEAADRVASYVVLGGSGAISTALAMLLPFGRGAGLLPAVPGLVYAMIGPVMGLYYGWWRPRRERRRTPEAPALDPAT